VFSRGIDKVACKCETGGSQGTSGRVIDWLWPGVITGRQWTMSVTDNPVSLMKLVATSFQEEATAYISRSRVNYGLCYAVLYSGLNCPPRLLAPDIMNDKALTEVKKFFERYIQDHELAFEQFFDFRNHEGNFSDLAVC
jgi:hypothetical protein